MPEELPQGPEREEVSKAVRDGDIYKRIHRGWDYYRQLVNVKLHYDDALCSQQYAESMNEGYMPKMVPGPGNGDGLQSFWVFHGKTLADAPPKLPDDLLDGWINLDPKYAPERGEVTKVSENSQGESFTVTLLPFSIFNKPYFSDETAAALNGLIPSIERMVGGINEFAPEFETAASDIIR